MISKIKPDVNYSIFFQKLTAKTHLNSFVSLHSTCIQNTLLGITKTRRLANFKHIEDELENTF